jgi:hypothetical protein
MELPSALFSDVTGSPAFVPNASPDELPVANWVFLGQKTSLLGDDETANDHAANCRIRRMSVRGVGLLYDRALEPGAEFTLLLPRQGRTPIAVRCAAVRCDEGCADALFRIGAVFTKVMGNEYQAAARSSERFGDRPIAAATLAA